MSDFNYEIKIDDFLSDVVIKKGKKIYGQYTTMDEAVENIMRIEKMINVTPETAARVANKIKKERHIDFNYCDYANIDFCGVLVFIGAVCAMIGVAACLMSACDLITWIIAPDIMSVQWVVDLMK